nr:glycoside hydrolase family 2 TIM barrel-domain containing protein [Caldilineaceae bacterium]
MTDTPQKNYPRPDYPRPYLRRAEWRSLNGPWRFAFDPHVHGEQMGWHRGGGPSTGSGGGGKELTISVPFPWESPLSGVAAPEYRGAGWYEREVTIPAEWTGVRPFLNFNAVDWSARVWVNGQMAAEHDNGYLPFSIDLSEYAQPGETVTVTLRAWDIAEATTLVGKQVPHWYTYSSGIWQSVWLEPRAASHITGVAISPDVANQQASAQVDLSVATAGSYRLRLSSPDDNFPAIESSHNLQPGSQTVALTFAVPKPKLWSPESPHLYDVRVELLAADGAGDSATTYFGMRTVSRGKWNGKEYEYILLNGEPVYLRGALDQAFHPDGLHTYPTDEIIRGDIQLAKELGLNLLRCHIKINDPRYYYWADKLGLLIFYDMPSPDMDTPSMRRTFEAALRGAIARDFNSPSIIAWIIFNETWGLTKHHTADGQRWLAELAELTRQLDPTRLVEDNSP